MKIKFRTLSGFVVASVIGLGAWRMSQVRAAEPLSPQIEQAADGSVTLAAKDAKIEGPNAKFEGSGDARNIAWWTDVDTSIHWTAKIVRPGKYRVELNFAVLGTRTSAELSVAAGDQATQAVLTPGNGLNDFKWGQAGEIMIRKAGEIPVSVTSVSLAHECVVYLRAMILRPAEAPSNAIDVTGKPIEPGEDGSYTLGAADAEINGMNALLETKGGEKDIGFWEGWETSADWKIDVGKRGKYRVELNYSLVPDSEGSKVAVLVGGQSVTARPKAGASWTDFKEGQAGEIAITGTGYFPVVVKPISKPGQYVIDLRSVTLAPVELPATAPDIRDKPITQSRDGAIKLTAEEGEIDGLVARLEGGETRYIVWRGNRDIGITWPATIDKPGTFNVMVTYSLAGTYGSDVTFSAGGQSVSGKLAPTGGWDNFKTEKLGSLDIRSKGALQVAMKSPMDPGLRIVNLRAVELVPGSK